MLGTPPGVVAAPQQAASITPQVQTISPVPSPQSAAPVPMVSTTTPQNKMTGGTPGTVNSLGILGAGVPYNTQGLY
jgi:hypothetical protein